MADEDQIEITLYVNREVKIYRIPPRAAAGGHTSGTWRVDDCIFTGALQPTSGKAVGMFAGSQLLQVLLWSYKQHSHIWASAQHQQCTSLQTPSSVAALALPRAQTAQTPLPQVCMHQSGFRASNIHADTSWFSPVVVLCQPGSVASGLVV